MAECAHEAVPPFGQQRLPDRIGRPFAHRVIQASAPPRIALGDRVSGIRRILSNYQRCLVWYIENFFGKLKEFKRIAMRSDKTDQSFAAMIHLAAAVIHSR